MIKVFLAGYYGFKNLGDELLLFKILQDITKIFPEAQFLIWSGDKGFTESFLRNFSVIAVDRFSVEETVSAVITSEVVILGGGGLIQEYYGLKVEALFKDFGYHVPSYAIPPFLAKIFGKKVFYWCLGHGPVFSEEGKIFSRWFYSLADIISVRDEYSFFQIKALSPQAKIFLDIDPLLDMDFSRWKVQKKEDKVLGVSLRKWFLEEEILKRVKTVLMRLMDEKRDLKILFIPCDLRGDLSLNLKLREGFPSERVLDYKVEDLFQIVSAISRCSFFLGMRLHSLILAYKLGIPLLGLSYDIKTQEFLESVNLDFIDLLELREENLYFKLKNLIENPQIFEEQTFLYRTPKIFEKFLKEESCENDRKIENSRLIQEEKKNYVSKFIKFLLFQREALEEKLNRNINKISWFEREREELINKISWLEREREREKEKLSLEKEHLVYRLNEIYSSNFWKVACKYYKLRDSTFLRKLYPYYKPVLDRIFKKSFEKKVLTDKKIEIDLVKKLTQIIGYNETKKVFLFYPIDWHHSLTSRPHHFAKEFSKKGYLTFFVTPNSIDKVRDFYELERNLYLVPKGSFLNDLSDSLILFASTDSDISLERIRDWKSKGNFIVYDYLDEISPEIGGKVDFILERHKKLSLKEVDLVCCVSNKLYEEEKKRFSERQLIYLPNACEYQHFNVTKNLDKVPEKMKTLLSEEPIIGYYGSLAEWIDYELLNYIAEQRPNWKIVLIGVDYDGSIKNLKSLPNIHYLGPVKYEELPNYAVWFDVALIPFKRGEIAKATSPIKLFEYLALGKVVLYTSDLVECKLYQ
ncbi:MAG: polysaccharide pyruvyl transferase family protein, partial [Thermodesulfobacteriaceae bacterium]|nr:polysaccharide pyruvyl transferase family protein [Thermodesulfobacteriaceae bacterium]